jgi:hypothetical protein
MAGDSSVDRLSQRLFESVAPHVPLAVKRPLKRAIPRRYYRYIDRDWHRYAVGGLWICEATGLDVKYLGYWGNPRNQKMIVFTRA